MIRFHRRLVFLIRMCHNFVSLSIYAYNYWLLYFSLKKSIRAATMHITGMLNSIVIFLSIFLVKILMQQLFFVLSYKYQIFRLKRIKGVIW